MVQADCFVPRYGRMFRLDYSFATTIRTSSVASLLLETESILVRIQIFE